MLQMNLLIFTRYDNAIHKGLVVLINVEAGNPFDASIVPGATDNESA